MDLSSRLNLIFFKSIFTWLAWQHPPRAQEIRLSEESRVLVFTNAGLGDALCNSVAIRALADAHPGIHLAAVVHHRRPYVVCRNPLLSKIYLFRKGPFAFLRLWWQLRGDGPWDLILYLSCNDPEPHCLGYLLNRNATIGMAHKTKFGHLCAHNLVGQELKYLHFLHQNLQIVQQTGVSAQTLRMVYEIAEEDRVALTQQLNAWGFPQEPKVILQLGGGGMAYRDWPIEHFVELAEGLRQAGIGRIFILGGRDHLKKAAEFTAKARKKNLAFYDVVGKFNFYLSAALVERARCLVSTDTGIMHLGFAIQVPTVALLHCHLGAARVGPLVDQDLHEVIEISRPENYRGAADVSMSTILPQEALERVLAILKRSDSQGMVSDQNFLTSNIKSQFSQNLIE